MKRSARWVGMLFFAGLLTGCVERKYVITSDPPGAVVLENGKPIGATPVDGSFVYHGDYQFTLMRDGYETLQVKQPIPKPWYEYFPIEFFSENVVPCRIRDEHRFHYQLQPLQTVRSDQVILRGEELRQRATTIGPPEKSGDKTLPTPPANRDRPGPIVGGPLPPAAPPTVPPGAIMETPPVRAPGP